ncbi:MAG: hypothetical protein ACLR76_04385 [Alistipes sp.]
MATRAASAAVLSYLAEHVQNMVVASADLATRTRPTVSEEDPCDAQGRFLRPSCSRWPVHDGLHHERNGASRGVPAWDFLRLLRLHDPYRLAALQRLPVKYVWTHDSFRVGEDARRISRSSTRLSRLME